MNPLPRQFNTAKILESYRKVAWFYDFWAWLTESKATKKVLDCIEALDGKAVLEVACGTGKILEKLARKNLHGTNIGIDLSPNMLAKAHKRMVKLETSNYELREGNVLHLDFQNDFFDLIVNNYMIDLMPEDSFDRIAQEFYRVLKPGGTVVMSTFSFGTKRIHLFWYWMAKKFPAILTGCRPVSFAPYLEKEGFQIVKILEISQNTFPSQVIRAVKQTPKN